MSASQKARPTSPWNGWTDRRCAIWLRPASLSLFRQSSASARIAEIAAIHATRGENDQAVEWLAKAFAAGYKDYATLARHPIFTKVRHDARFQNVLKQMEQTVADMRERSTVLAELRTMPFPDMRP
jgi:hypothetical protein